LRKGNIENENSKKEYQLFHLYLFKNITPSLSKDTLHLMK
jgi:hypothetical protein